MTDRLKRLERAFRCGHALAAAVLLALVLVDSAAAETVALVADRLIDGRADRARDGVVVVIEDDRIAVVGDRSAIPPGAAVIELPGATLMPGMINAHEHPMNYADDYQNAHLQSFVDGLATDETTKEIISYMNLLQHMEEFGKGVVDTRRLVYYFTTSALFLFLTSRALAAKKWR